MKVYFSHSIRGKLGADCPPVTLRENCEIAIEIANKIRAACPWAELYVPAEHEEFVQRTYDKKYMTEKQILDVDCDIIAEQDVIIIFIPDGYDSLQGGRLVEHDFAINECLPVGLFITASEAVTFLTERHEYDLHYGGAG